ncbi:hypothetical protein P879_04872 [Paragonimus westermani]|uniref:Uncharacterized protein n=1 Tax=Paragonimus westermani TaxID=34504 RepID=A0A8T0DRP6_9TREM|nr:hypothetical protein P879_04872 [Paragonimus westermani]
MRSALVCEFFVLLYSTTVLSKLLCAEPEETCSTFRPCCGRDLVCKRQDTAEGYCEYCAKLHETCHRSIDCCVGVCIHNTCRHIMREE